LVQRSKNGLFCAHWQCRASCNQPNIATAARRAGKPQPAPSFGKTNASTPSEPAVNAATCKHGFVWRAARPDDLVCVTSESRARVAEENRTAAERVQPSAAPNCRSGYVWREAFNGDLVCVTPLIRAFTREENQLGPSRRAQQ
jgi:hypothetical protein